VILVPEHYDGVFGTSTRGVLILASSQPNLDRRVFRSPEHGVQLLQ
jgi:hypothetical protein